MIRACPPPTLRITAKDSIDEESQENAMNLEYVTLIHVIISLVGIASGFGVLAGLLTARVYPRWTAVFLATTVATSVTGFFFPFRGVTPAFAFGVVSLVLLAVAIYALYARRLARRWKRAYAITALIALYLNFFVLIAQMFAKVPEIRTLAPTQTELPFLITQLLVLAVFVGLGCIAVIRLRAEPTSSVRVDESLEQGDANEPYGGLTGKSLYSTGGTH
jgi:hypothetical protein